MTNLGYLLAGGTDPIVRARTIVDILVNECALCTTKNRSEIANALVREVI